jgi:hypothetical protein
MKFDKNTVAKFSTDAEESISLIESAREAADDTIVNNIVRQIEILESKIMFNVNNYGSYKLTNDEIMFVSTNIIAYQ